VFYFSIDWIIIANGIPGVLNIRVIADVVDQVFVVTVDVDRASPAIYKGVIVGILKKEAQDSIDTICFGQARVHVLQVAWSVSFAAPYFRTCPDDPCTGSSAIGMHRSIADKEDLEIG